MKPLVRLLFALFFFISIVLTRSADSTATTDSRLIRIATAHSALTLMVAADGRVYELGYGSAEKFFAPTNRATRETEAYPQYGDGFGERNLIIEPAIQAAHADGNTSTDLIYVKHTTETVDPDITLTRIELKDPAYPFFVTLCLRSFRDEDLIEQWSEIRQEEAGPVTLYRFASAAPFWSGGDYWLTQFHGSYKHEATLAEEKLSLGIKILDSKLGVRADYYRIPSFLLSLGGPATEDTGEVYGGSLEWSGSFQLAFEVNPKNQLRALCGINPLGSQYRLKPGQTFTTPALLSTWSGAGKGQVSRNFHRWALRYGIRDGAKPRPVLLNNWEATGFDFDEKTIVSLFAGAREIGVDTFLLDDGWFGNAHPRNLDNAGLGDWQVNTNKLPHGLAYLADQAKKYGIHFGIWIEPEMVNPSSDLYLKHPEWAMQQPHRQSDLSRNQLVLDLTRPAVQEFVWKAVDDTLGTPGVSYVKWDANRFVTQPGSTYLPPDEQSHLLIDYTWALYGVMSNMAKTFPDIMAMACSGGGGRVDYGSLKYFDSFWPSDNTDPRSRVFIQWGFSHFFPATTIAAHVTRMGNRPLKFAMDVAMSGALGVDMDLRKLKPEERQSLAAAIARYQKEIRDVVEQGDLYRLESPYDRPRAALDYVSPDRSQAVLFVYQLKAGAGEAVKPRGLDPQKRYRVQEVNLPGGTESKLADNGKVVDGATLMRDGLVPPCQNEFDSVAVELVGEK